MIAHIDKSRGRPLVLWPPSPGFGEAGVQHAAWPQFPAPEAPPPRTTPAEAVALDEGKKQGERVFDVEM
jgi:hypothetical protein